MDTSLRNELVAARAKIVEQLDDLEWRSIPYAQNNEGGPPDYRSIAATLRDQLSEIDKLLKADDA